MSTVVDVRRIAPAVLSGPLVVFQRVVPGVTADLLAVTLTTDTGLTFVASKDAFEDAAPNIVDWRTGFDFAALDAHRPALVERKHPLVVCLDVASSKALLTHAPQTASYCSGVQLPHPSGVRPARTDEEVRLGRDILARRLREEPEADLHRGESVGVSISSGRLFFRQGGRSPLQIAEEELDAAILYVGRVPRD